MVSSICNGEERGKHFASVDLCGLAGWATLLLFIIALWHVLSAEFPILVASPSETFRYLVNIRRDVLFRALRITLFNSVVGFTIAFILVSVVSLLAFLNSFFRQFAYALNKFIQSVSVLVWSILFIIIFGVTSFIPPILVTAMASFPVLISSMIKALDNLEKEYFELSKILEMNKYQEFIHIIVPGSVPYLISASRSALGIALRISVVAEAFGASGGIGYQIVYSYDLGIKVGVFAWSSLLVILMIVLDQLILGPLERWSQKWL